MPRRNFTIHQTLLNIPFEFQEAKGVRNAGSFLLDFLCQFFLSPVKGLLEGLVGPRQFDGVEVFSLQVFGEREREHLFDFADKDGDLFEPRLTGGPQASFAGDQFKCTICSATHHERLKDTICCDRPREFFDGLRIEDSAGLIGIGVDLSR